MKTFVKSLASEARAEWRSHSLPLAIAASDDVTDTPVAWIVASAAQSRVRLPVLLVSDESRLRVNGAAPLPVVVLADRDEIRTDGRLYLLAAYQGDDGARVVDDGREIRCAGCGTAIEAGERAVRCPACPALFHADPPKQPDGSRTGANCKDYDLKCRECQRPWASMAWTPEDLGYA